MGKFALDDVEPNRLRALVKNIMRQTGKTDPDEAVRAVNSGEWILINPMRRSRESNGVIYFSVTSDGTTGPDWITRLEQEDSCLSDFTKSLLRSNDFKPTNGVTTKIAVLKGILFDDEKRTIRNIFAEADKRKLTKPSAEVACLICEFFLGEEPEVQDFFYLSVMHKSINGFDGKSGYLGVDYHNVDPELYAEDYDLDSQRGWDEGFAFAVPQAP
jgi:hypothetical protein